MKGVMVMCNQNCDSSYIYFSFYATVYVEKFCFVLLLSFIMLAVMYTRAYPKFPRISL